MIALEGVSAKRSPLALVNISLALAGGAHAIVGRPSDGGPLLLAIVAGLARPRAGRVRVLEGAPTDGAVRRQVALVPLDPALPDALRVREAIALAAAVRREPARDEAKRLAILGVESLVDRPVRSLSRAEARAVALAEAVTSTCVRVILVEEPLVAVDPRAVGLLPGVLRDRAGDGCAIVVATGSMRDAGDLADHLISLRGGAIADQTACVDSLAEIVAGGGRVAHLSIVLRDGATAAALVAALAREVDVESMDRDEGAVRLRGRDAAELARAAGRAVIEAGVDIAEMRFDVHLASNERPGPVAQRPP